MTGIGLPLALVGAAIGLIAAFIDWGWGESNLTGQARRDLRALGISDAEEDAFDELATSVRTRKHPIFHRDEFRVPYPSGETYTTQERQRADHDTVLRQVANASTAQKVGMINVFLEEATSASEETLVYRVLKQTPYEHGQFLELMEALDCRRLAQELEDDRQAGIVMKWTAVAYNREGRPPGRAFIDQLMQHAEDQHEGAIDVFLEDVDRPIYQRIEPTVLLEATRKLLAGHASRGESRTIARMLWLTSWAQFNAVIERGNVEYVRQLRSSLQAAELRQVMGWMRRPEASDTVKRLEQSRDTFHRLTTSVETREIDDELGHPFTTTGSFRQSNEEIRRRAAVANRFEKAVLIRTLLDAPNPPAQDENLVYHVLREAPYTNNEFLQLMESLPVARVARKLENDEDAGRVLTWTLKAYGLAGREPGDAFYTQLETHCRYQRWVPVQNFMVRVVEPSSDANTVDRSIYNKVAPKKIVAATSMFAFNEDTTRNEALTTFNMLAKTSFPQFNRVIELGHLRYILRLREALEASTWQRLHDWMTHASASPAVQHLALQVRR
jgi:hypothetical protein